MPDYATTSFWFNWVVFGAAISYLLIMHRPSDWVGIRQALGLAAMLLILGFGWGAAVSDGDLLTMLLMKNGRGEEVCVAGGYACLAYAVLATPVALIKQAVDALKHRRHSPNETETLS